MRLECGPMPNAVAALPNILWRHRLCVELYLTVQRDVERAGTDTQTCDTGVSGIQSAAEISRPSVIVIIINLAAIRHTLAGRW